ncbi:hypothetical protein BDZ45DRAFT_43250 [Acephala macrosclerotiorum]|nr:hypothetical protein BDZ45DRAFT_43250 [Acephala macrosclerotiorum]
MSNNDASIDASLSATHCLHLAVRLFNALSRIYDPIMRDYSIESNAISSEEKTLFVKDHQLAARDGSRKLEVSWNQQFRRISEPPVPR